MDTENEWKPHYLYQHKFTKEYSISAWLGQSLYLVWLAFDADGINRSDFTKCADTDATDYIEINPIGDLDEAIKGAT